MLTYSGIDKQAGRSRQGGYSDHMVVRQEFRARSRDGLDISRAAPLLCAGITTYSPLRKYKVGPGQQGRSRRASAALVTWA